MFWGEYKDEPKLDEFRKRVPKECADWKGPPHANQGGWIVEQVLAASGYDEHVERLRQVYAGRRDALAAALREHLPAGCRFALPAGGFFVWLELPEGSDASALLPVAEALGVSFAPGARFCLEGGERLLRLAFSLYSEDTLREGARRLAAAMAATPA